MLKGDLDSEEEEEGADNDQDHVTGNQPYQPITSNAALFTVCQSSLRRMSDFLQSLIDPLTSTVIWSSNYYSDFFRHQ